MRTFERRHRFTITKENEVATFQGELEYYRTNNVFPVKILGNKILNIYKNINLQLVLGKACNYKCQFCIENDNISGDTSATDYAFIDTLDDVISDLRNYGITPWISITGGEPTLFKNRLQMVYNLLSGWDLEKRANVNTNGTNLGLLEKMKGFRINLSRHHYCESKSREIFGSEDCSNYIMADNVVLQCVMMKGYIDSVTEMKKYMDFYSGIGATGFSFRGLSTLDAGKQYEKEVNFSLARSIDFFAIVNAVANDPEFEFLQQKIGDHYFFEIYKYKGKVVRFTYSNFEFLRKVETEERAMGQWFSRATIISPKAKVYAGWTYDINEIVRKPLTW